MSTKTFKEVDTLKVVDDYLKERRSQYIDFQNDLEGELKRFKNMPEWNDVIYKVYSRAEKQPNEPLKTSWKIAEKLDSWRKDKLTTLVSDIHDIIGLTIIVTFPSDVLSLEKHFNKKKKIGNFRLFDGESKNDETIKGKTKKGELKKGKGYYAYHFKVKNDIEPNYRNILCEIQIKTILHDAWSAKTHDLTYKPKGEIDDGLNNHMNILGDELMLLDWQSEIIKNLITEKWNTDKNRKAAAKQALLISLLSGINDKVADLAKKINSNINILENTKATDKAFRDYFKPAWDLFNEYGYNIRTCSLFILLASFLESGELNNLAITTIDNWKNTASNKTDIAKAFEIRALANYTFGKFKDALNDAAKTLEYCEKSNLEINDINKAKMDYSYFIAEAHFHHPKKFGQESEARKLITEAMKDLSEVDKPAFIDTLGAIEIAFGKDEAQILNGLHLCREVHDSIPDNDPSKDVADAYFRLHERRAWRRLLEWE